MAGGPFGASKMDLAKEAADAVNDVRQDGPALIEPPLRLAR